jgi:hypothetical protein
MAEVDVLRELLGAVETAAVELGPDGPWGKACDVIAEELAQELRSRRGQDELSPKRRGRTRKTPSHLSLVGAS